ncbi:hypothetical protein Scep_007299 [Stephania cephalantha]|uniref:DUF4283 domain-containing protein n=1 Tax=Stephania cephalantha TaxID=152367 RepID=A0AAP0K9T1_9MAGN
MDHYIVVRKWVPNFVSGEIPISTIPVWIWLPKLLLEFYDDEMLKRIRNSRSCRFEKTIRMSVAHDRDDNNSLGNGQPRAMLHSRLYITDMT